MKLTRMVLALALGSAGMMQGAALAAPVACSGEFVLHDPAGGMFDTDDGAAGNSAYVTGVIDLAAGTFTVSFTDTWRGLNWSASGGTLFGPGTYTHSTEEET